MKAFFGSQFYFFFCLILGAFSLFAVTTETSSSVSGNVQLSSYKSAQSELYSAEMNSFEAGLADQAIIEEFTLAESDLRARGNESEHILSLKEQENFEMRFNALSRSLMQPSSFRDDIYEDISLCTGESLELEKSISGSAVIADLVRERPETRYQMSRGCVSYIMKGMRDVLPSSRIARCAGGPMSEPEREGPRVCITKAMVNVTYNSYVDVAMCLGLNPQDILPKLANESGLLINTYGGGSDAGVGQLTRPAIEDVNNNYNTYLAEMESQAKTNPACARVMKHKALLAPVPKEITSRCALMTAPENPLKNIVYMAIFNKININNVKRRFESNNIIGKLELLGLRHINEEQLIGAIAMAGYNSGVGTSFRILNNYLDARINAGLRLKPADFDFHNFPKVYDEIGQKETDLPALARSYVYSVYISEKDTPETKLIKAQRIKLLPRKIKESYKLTFPEYMVYNQNNFDGVSNVIDANFKNVGAPGYLTYLAMNDIKIKKEFEGKGMNCSNPSFFKIK